jgi:hypothetical protein
MHKASDGSLYETKEKYLKHEEMLNIETALGFVELDTSMAQDVTGDSTYVYVEERAEDEDDTFRAIPIAYINKFITTNADVLRDVLNNAVVPKRVRKTTEK